MKSAQQPGTAGGPHLVDEEALALCREEHLLCVLAHERVEERVKLRGARDLAAALRAQDSAKPLCLLPP